jgi:hypothetical protein
MWGQDGGACEQVCATKPLKSRHIQNSLSKIRYCGSGLRWNAYSFRRLASNVYFTSSTCTIALHKHQNFSTRWGRSYGVCQHIICYGLLATLEWMPLPRYTMTGATWLPDSSCKDPFEFPIHKQVLGSTETQEHRDTCICPITASFWNCIHDSLRKSWAFKLRDNHLFETVICNTPPFPIHRHSFYW